MMVFITSTDPPVKWVGGALETSPLLPSTFLFASLSLPLGLTAEKSAEKCREWILIPRHLSTKRGGDGSSDDDSAAGWLGHRQATDPFKRLRGRTITVERTTTLRRPGERRRPPGRRTRAGRTTSTTRCATACSSSWPGSCPSPARRTPPSSAASLVPPRAPSDGHPAQVRK